MWRRRRSGSDDGPDAPHHDRSDGENERLRPQDLAIELDAIQRAVSERNEPSLATLYQAANEIAAEWFETRDRLLATRAELDLAIRTERAIRDRLQQLLQLIRSAVPTAEAAGADGAGTDGARVPDRRSGPTRPPSVLGGPTPSALRRGPTVVDTGASVGGREDPADTAMAAPQSPPAEGLAVFLFGSFRLQLNGSPVDLGLKGKALSLLRYLLAHRDRPTPKDVLMDLFWPQASLERSRHGLHQAIYTIRKALRAERADLQLIVFEEDAYRVAPEMSIWCDVEAYEALVQQGEQAAAEGDVDRARRVLERADLLRAGDLVEDAPFEDWVLVERERMRPLHVRAGNLLADLLEAGGDHPRTIEVSERVLAVEPCNEESHRRIIRCHFAAGNRPAAIRQYQTCVERLRQTYGLEPSPETLDLYRSLIASDNGGLLHDEGQQDRS
ncbi:MAG: BTAD domain-containing putative transcriptional regulator, partial [Actinomycetota bacterium]